MYVLILVSIAGMHAACSSVSSAQSLITTAMITNWPGGALNMIVVMIIVMPML